MSKNQSVGKVIKAKLASEAWALRTAVCVRPGHQSSSEPTAHHRAEGHTAASSISIVFLSSTSRRGGLGKTGDERSMPPKATDHGVLS